jgi:glycosyltransferase involved in cell wall biosynthesis
LFVTDPLHVTHAVLSLDTGGLERIVVDLVRRGQQLDQRVSVVCLERPGVLAPQVEALGARVVCLDKKPGVRFETKRRLRTALADLRPDVLHTHQVGALFYAGPAARSCGVPVVVHTEHINNIRKQGSGFFRRQKMALLWWWAARQARKFFCVSADIADEMATRRIVPRHKLEVLLNGINTEPFRRPVDRAAVRQALGIPDTAPVIGTVGRLNEVKRQDLLLAAFAGLRAAHGTARLLLVGDGPMRGELEALASRLGVADRVHFAGYQAQPERYLAVMDVFALTSRMEGLPLAILEAWAAGLPVVGSSVGGVPDLVEHDRTGLLFPSGDEATLTALLSELLTDRTRAAALGAAGREEVFARYDLQRMAGDYDRHYRELLRATPHPIPVAS